MEYTNKVAIFLSGASTRIGMLAGSVITLVRTYKVSPQVYVGTSSGALLSFIFALGFFQRAKNKVLNFTIKDIFKHSPGSLLGLLKGINNILHGYYHLFDQSNLRKTLESLISEEEFNDWVKDKSRPDAYVGIYNIETRSKDYVSLKSKKYKEAIDKVIASASIPVAASPVFIDGQYYYDGGVRDHIGGAWYIKNKHKDIKECISIFSRPEVFKKGSNNKRFEILPPTKLPKLKNILRVLGLISELYTVMQYEISKNDEVETDLLCEKHGIKHTKIFASKVLSTGLYETTIQQNKDNYEDGVNQTIKMFN